MSRCRWCDNAKGKRYYAANRERVIARVMAKYKPILDGTCRKDGCEKQTPSSKHWYCEEHSLEAKQRDDRIRERRPEKLAQDRKDYGYRHQRLRKIWDRVVKRGGVRCARGADCFWAEGNLGGLIQPWDPWDLGHDPQDRTKYAGPEHRRCNRATAGRHQAERKTSREW